MEQRRRFELLRLAFFVLKLRKLEQRLNNEQGGMESPEHAEDRDEQSGKQLFRCNLLRHVIFQQVVTLIRLDSREQAMQIIEACREVGDKYIHHLHIGIPVDAFDVDDVGRLL